MWPYDAGARQAFIHTLRAVLDIGGQRVSATDRLIDFIESSEPTQMEFKDSDFDAVRELLLRGSA